MHQTLLYQTIIVSFLMTLLRQFFIEYIIKSMHWIRKNLYNKSEQQLHKQLASKLLCLRNELHHTSAIDEFAKWAKTNRQVTQLQGDFDKLYKSMQLDRSTFHMKWSLILRVLIYFIDILFVMYCSRSDAIMTDSSNILYPWTIILSIPFHSSSK